MNNLTLETLTLRLDQLERQVWWWKVVGGATVGVLGLVLLIGAVTQTTPREIRAHRLVVVDDAENPRIVLGKNTTNVFYDDHYEVSLVNRQGAPTVTLYLREEASSLYRRTGLELLDPKGYHHVSLSTYLSDTSKEANLLLDGAIQEDSSLEAITLGVKNNRAPNASSSASLQLRTGRVGGTFSLDGKNTHLSFFNYKDDPPVIVLDTQKGMLNLGMYEGRPTLTMDDTILDGPGLAMGNVSLSDPSGGTLKLPASSLVLFGKGGKVIWRVPK